MSTLRSGRSRIVLALLLVISLGGGLALWSAHVVGQDSPKAATDQPVEHAKSLSRAFRKAAESVSPTVVTVRSKTKAQAVKKTDPRIKRENPFKGTPFEDFFNGDEFDGQMPNMPRREGMGSGVIIDKSGVVLTNNHVVQGADEVVVELSDGREFKAEDIKVDEQTDLAVLRIKDAGSLPAATLGDSDAMEIGDWVLAIGNPFELEHTVSAGIISGKGRELGAAKRAKFLQTDAAINPGNSGGPLVNLEGEVVGINTAIATNTGSFNGVGFAVPSNLAKWVVDQLMHQGSVQRAYLGVSISRIGRPLAEKFHVRPDEGVLIEEVHPNTPAAEAGFQGGDIVKSFAGQAVHNPRELQELVERVPLGSKHKVEVLRDGKTETLTIVAKALPEKFGQFAASRPTERGSTGGSNFEMSKLGLEVTEAGANDLKSLGYEGFSGVLISKVDPEGVAAEQGLRQGMLIMKVGKKTVKDIEEFKAAIDKESLEDGILLQVRTKAGNHFVVLQR